MQEIGWHPSPPFLFLAFISLSYLSLIFLCISKDLQYETDNREMQVKEREDMPSLTFLSLLPGEASP